MAKTTATNSPGLQRPPQTTNFVVVPGNIKLLTVVELIANQLGLLLEECSSATQENKLQKMDQLREISSCLTENYLSEKLTDWFQRDVEFVRAQFNDGATGKGDSYLSTVHRVAIYGRLKSTEPDEDPDVVVPTILKRFPISEAIRKTFRSHTFFKNEILFYKNIVPEFMKFQAEKKIKDPFINLPKIFASETNGVDDFIAMEDLRSLDYTMPVRQDHIDSHHMEMILKTFAKFHAISFAFKDQHPEKYETVTSCLKEMYYDHTYWDWYKGFWKRLCRISLDAIHKEYPNTVYEERVKKFAVDETYNKMIDAALKKRDSAVVSHGDSWTPNFLFQYENNIPVKSMMIDFQLARNASPILDISFFIYACGAEKEYLKSCYDILLKCYYDKLAEQIHDLGSDPNKIYPWTTFMKEVKELSYFGVGFAMESTPVIILEPDEAMDMDSLTGTEPVPIDYIWCLEPIKSKKGRQRLCDIFVHAVDHNFI